MQVDTPPTSVSELPTLELLEGLANLHQMVLVIDEDERIVWTSGSLHPLPGRSEHVVDRHAGELLDTRTRHALRQRMEREGSVANQPVEVQTRDGAAVPIDLSLLPLQGPGGRAFVVAIVRPVQGDEARRRELRQTVDYYRAILESSPEAMLALDRQGFVTYANAALERLLGRSREELLDRPVSLALPRAHQLEAVTAVLQPDAGCDSAEVELTGPTGRRLLISVSTSRLSLPDGSHAGTVAFLRDVTLQRRFEQQLERKNDELEHYVHAVSHDLRTPLVSLLGFSRLLAQDYGDVLTDTGRHFLERIEQASRTMESLINDLLELSRIGAANGQREMVDPLGLLKQLLHDLKPRLDAAGMVVALPESPPPVHCIRTQLYQVFANLLGNALEHMGEVPAPSVDVSVFQEPDRHVLCVRDNGVGIPAEQHERVFEVFHTIGARGAGRRGTGIGLAIVKKVAEGHGGHVWLESEPGEGAAFYVALPRP